MGSFLHPLQVCEPMPVFYVVFSWPQVFSFYWFTRGFAALAAVILIKAILFCGFGKITPGKGIPSMVLANVVSSVPGVLLAFFLSVIPAILFSLIGLVIGGVVLALYYWTTRAVAKRFIGPLAATSWGFLTPELFVFGSLGLGVGSLIFAGIAQTIDFDISGQSALYWTVKFLALFCGLLSSIALTICWEGAVNCAILRAYDKNRILKATVTANLVLFFSIFAIGACLAWPERMRNRHWLLPPK